MSATSSPPASPTGASPNPSLDFRLVFPSESKNPHTRARSSTINSARATLHGSLFFDELLATVAHLDGVIYPARSTPGFRLLHSQIVGSATLDPLKKHCFLYYLLLDWDEAFPPAAGEQGAAARFRAWVNLPETFAQLMTGVWELDNLRFDAAVGSLLYPGVTAPMQGKVLATLAEYGTAQQVVAFVKGIGMELGEMEDVERYFYALVEMDVGAALAYLRDVPRELKEGLFAGMVERCLEDGGVRMERLIGLPLRGEETEWLVEGLRRSENGRDALIVWLTHMGRFQQALELMESAEAKATREGDVDWPVLGEALRKGLGGRVGA